MSNTNHTTSNALELTHAETAERTAIELLNGLSLVDQALNGLDADLSFDAWLAAGTARKSLQNLLTEIGKITATAQCADRAMPTQAAEEFNALVFA